MSMSWEAITLIAVLAHVAIGFVATIVISAQRPPAAAVAWVLAIIFIPVLYVVIRTLAPGKSREAVAAGSEEVAHG